MTNRSDILVIGGGIAGIGAASCIAGEATVTVLEGEAMIGHHATGRSAAIYIRNYGNATLRALNAASEPFFEQPDGVADGSLLTPRGEMLIATEEEMPEFEAYLADASGVETLSPDEAVARVPILRRAPIVAASYEPAAQDIDVDRLLQGMARRIRAHGGRIVTGAPATAITRTGGIWRVETPAGRFEAAVLVNAAGAWADAVARMAGVAPVGLVPMRRSAALLPPPAGHDIRHWPLFASASERWYAKPEAGKLLVSPAEEEPVEPHDAWPDDMALAEGLDRFEQAVTMAVTRVDHSWAGLRSFVRDRSPVVGLAPDSDGFLWLAGQGGYGVQTAPALSALAADLVLGRGPALPADVVAALHPARLFRAG